MYMYSIHCTCTCGLVCSIIVGRVSMVSHAYHHLGCVPPACLRPPLVPLLLSAILMVETQRIIDHCLNVITRGRGLIPAHHPQEWNPAIVLRILDHAQIIPDHARIITDHAQIIPDHTQIILGHAQWNHLAGGTIPLLPTGHHTVPRPLTVRPHPLVVPRPLNKWDVPLRARA